MTTDGIYKLVRSYAKKLGLEIGVHSLPPTNALEHERTSAHFKDPGAARASEHRPTRLYDRRKSKPEVSPAVRLKYQEGLVSRKLR